VLALQRVKPVQKQKTGIAKGDPYTNEEGRGDRPRGYVVEIEVDDRIECGHGRQLLYLVV